MGMVAVRIVPCDRKRPSISRHLVSMPRIQIYALLPFLLLLFVGTVCSAMIVPFMGFFIVEGLGHAHGRSASTPGRSRASRSLSIADLPGLLIAEKAPFR
jgi:hypothetical protein